MQHEISSVKIEITSTMLNQMIDENEGVKDMCEGTFKKRSCNYSCPSDTQLKGTNQH